MKKISFAVVGTNFISSHFLDAIKVCDRASVAAVYSRTKEKGTQFAEMYGIEKVYTSYSEMLADPSIDAVYVASPTMLHKEHSIAALRAGKHVLSEKMIAVCHGEFLEMRRAAEEEGLVLIEAMRPDFDKLFARAEATLPALGKIKSAELEFCQYSSRYDNFKNGIVENAFNPEMKNSALSDIGIYPLHSAVRLFGIPEDLKSKSCFLENGFEAEGEITLFYKDFPVKITYSKIKEGENVSKIVGEYGTLLIGKINYPKFLRHYAKDGSLISETLAEEYNILSEINAFCDIVESGTLGRSYLDISDSTMRLVDLIYKSSGITFPL